MLGIMGDWLCLGSRIDEGLISGAVVVSEAGRGVSTGAVVVGSEDAGCLEPQPHVSNKAISKRFNPNIKVLLCIATSHEHSNLNPKGEILYP